MENNENEQDEYAFANALGDSQIDEDARGVQPEDGGEAQPDDQSEKIRKLQEELDAQKELVNQANNRLSKFDKFANAFKDEEPDEESLREERIRNFDVDPLTGVKDIVSEDIDYLKSEINNIKSTRVAQEAMSAIDRDWDVNWEKNKSKIKAELETLSPEYRQKNPTMAILRAARLAGVATKKDKMAQPLNPGYTPAERKQYERTVSDSIIDSIERGRHNGSSDERQKSATQALDALFN